MSAQIVLETQRLRLLTWEPKDWIVLRAIATDSDVMRYITDGIPWPDEEIQAFVARQIENFARQGFCLWKLLSKADSRVLGFCGLQPVVVEGMPEIEIGWWLAKDCWGKGLATEAARGALRDGFERLGLTRVVALSRPDNAASLRVMERLGMNYEREIVHKGAPVVVYSVGATLRPRY